MIGSVQTVSYTIDTAISQQYTLCTLLHKWSSVRREYICEGAREAKVFYPLTTQNVYLHLHQTVAWKWDVKWRASLLKKILSLF